MMIEITRPIFKCADDENIFFSRLRELPEFVQVVGKGTKLHLTLNTDVEEHAIPELNEICNIWHTTFTFIG